MPFPYNSYMRSLSYRDANQQALGDRLNSMQFGGADSSSPPPVDLSQLNDMPPVPDLGGQRRDSYQQRLMDMLDPAPPSRTMYGDRSRPRQQIDIKFARQQSPDVMRAFHGQVPQDIHYQGAGTSSPEEDQYRQDVAAMAAPPPPEAGSTSSADYNARVGDWTRRRGQAFGRRDQHLGEAEASGNADIADMLKGEGAGKGKAGSRPDPTLQAKRLYEMQNPQHLDPRTAYQGTVLQEAYKNLLSRRRDAAQRRMDAGKNVLKPEEIAQIDAEARGLDDQISEVRNQMMHLGLGDQASAQHPADHADQGAPLSPQESMVMQDFTRSLAQRHQ